MIWILTAFNLAQNSGCYMLNIVINDLQACQLVNIYDNTWVYGIVWNRGETIWVNAILCIAFECIAIYCHIAIFDWILVKRYFVLEYGFWQ